MGTVQRPRKRGPKSSGAPLLRLVLAEPGVTYLELARHLKATVEHVARVVRLYEEVGLLEVQWTRGVACVRCVGRVVQEGVSNG